MNPYFLSKMVLSGLIIALTSWLAGRKPFLAGFLIALPIMSLLSILFTYFETRNMDTINNYATSILVSVPLSLLFFVPFVLNRWLHLNFYVTLVFSLSLLFLAFLVHHFIFSGK